MDSRSTLRPLDRSAAQAIFLPTATPTLEGPSGLRTK
jgi:hypothetical protein